MELVITSEEHITDVSKVNALGNDWVTDDLWQIIGWIGA